MLNDMVRDIYLLSLGFHPVVVVGTLVHKYERQLYTKVEIIQKYKIQKIENKHTKEETRHKKILKNISRVIRK